MRRRLPLLLPASMLTLLLAAGCGNACLELADQICGCQPDQVTQANCQQRARDEEGVFNVRKQDEQFCQHLLDTHSCDCKKLDTPEGRQACGTSISIGPADHASIPGR
jgi:hypothetical protein